MKDYYLIMALPPSATAAEIKAAYRRQAKIYHPDKNQWGKGDKPSADAMQMINEAYAVLGDPAKRRAYDLARKVREFVPPVVQTGGAIDLLGMLQQAVRGRVPQQFVDQFSPVLERKLEERGVKARAVTAEDAIEALGWLKPKRKKRAS